MRKLLLFVFILSAYSASLYATHNRAGEITYKHLTGYTYEITVTTYTNTVNTSADRCELTVYFGDGDSAIFPRINGTSTLCPSTADGVMISSSTKLNVYVGTHTYPGPGNYHITMEDPNRNAGICNIPNSVNASFFLTTELILNPFLPPNSSPTLLNPPLDDACVGECFEHNPGAFDADGDSLHYSLVACYANGVPIPGYTLPPNFTSSLVNPLTGDIGCWFPPTICQYNIAILIKEYKLQPGTSQRYYVGSILRDMQIDVLSCQNNGPVIKPVNDTCVLAGSALNFTVSATDPNNNLLTLTASGGPFQVTPAATFASTPSVSPVIGTFSWTPGCDQIQLLPYLVTFKVTDNHPTWPLVNYESAFIRVIAPPPTGLTATPSGASIVLGWTASICSSTVGPNPLLGYKIYRKNVCDTVVPVPCQTGVDPSWGYTLIGTTLAGITTFTDNNNGLGLTHGVDYSYLVVAYYTDGSQSYTSSNICSHLTRDVPIITNVSVMSTGNNDSIWVHWVKPLGLNGNLDTIANPGPYEYRLMKAQGMTGALTFNQVSSYTYPAFWQLTDTGYISKNLNTEDSAYTFRVDFYSNGLLKGSTQTASSVFLTSTPADNKVNLTWTEIVPWINYKYFIYKETSAGSGVFNLLDSTSIKSYTDIGLVNGANYCYKIRSKGQYSDPALPRPLYNMSQKRCESPIDTVPPCQPDFAITEDCILFQNLITWYVPNNSNCDDEIIQVNIYYAPTTDKPLELIFSTTDMTITSYTHINDFEGQPSVAGCYAVTALDSFLNESVIIQKVCVDNCPEYELPNVFTPNSDGNNDLFIPLPYKFVKDIELTIYDRWGLLVFESTNPDILWNGNNKDTKKPCSDGTYYYVCKVNEIRVEGIRPRILKGYVQLINNKP